MKNSLMHIIDNILLKKRALIEWVCRIEEYLSDRTHKA